MLERVTLLVNYNLYESKRHFTKKLAEAMEKKGIETQLIDLQEQPFEASTAIDIQNFNPDFTCSFNSIAPVSEEKYVWDFMKIPHLSMLVDPAIYSFGLTRSPYSILSCVDRQDCQALGESGFHNMFFLPHATDEEIKMEVKERPYDVVFIGSCYDYKSLQKYWNETLPQPIRQALELAIALVITGQYTSLANALNSVWSLSKLPVKDVNFNTLFRYLDHYTRGMDRVQLIRSIKDVKVHVFGDLMIEDPTFKLGWKDYLADQSNVVMHPAITYDRSFEILQKSKFCLNSMPFFKDGSHERIFNSLACGALPITSESVYLREQFESNKEILFYKSTLWEKINEPLKHLLDHPNELRKMVDSGRNKVMRHHTWSNRVDQLNKELPPILNKIS